MKLGLNTAILEHMTFDELVPFVSKIGFESIEVACWPQGEAERRYAGVSHIDVTNLTQDKIDHIHQLTKEHHIEIAALAFYPNTLDPDPKTRQFNIDHLKKVIVAANQLGVELVTTFIGRDPKLNMDENLEIMKEVWPDIVKFAKSHNIKIAIENCPMWFTNDEWPGGKNLFISPKVWRKVFEIIPDDNLGINYDPSHFVWQFVDYIKPLYEFKDRIFMVHYKDMKVYHDRLNEVGTTANPTEYMAPKLPGLGDVDWSQYVSALNDINFTGHGCIEVEDKAYENTTDDIEKSVELSYRYLRQYLI
ncbi:MAG: sugar phosphate isomerase/epimerase [Erysipelothrix sp.]|nr:sugar phosphate isomerase/epimerase [Erysipelothrix sp.]